MILRKEEEKKIIKNEMPLSQSGIDDRQKNVEARISALMCFLDNL